MLPLYFKKPLDMDWRIAYPCVMEIERNGRERLAQWISRSKLNQLEASRLIGIDPSQLNQILSGRRRPGLDNAVKIEHTTGIVVEAWVPSTMDTNIDETSDETSGSAFSKA